MEQITFEQAMDELNHILDTLSAQETGLEQSLALYAHAAELVAQCGKELKQAKLKLEEIDAKLLQDDEPQQAQP